MTYLPSRKQDTLVSGTNIKTVNGNSLIGSGNITISGSTLADGDYGDITVGGSGTTMTIDNSVVGVSKLSATGTPSATTFLRGDNTWATPTDPAGWTTIVKSANQDVTNSNTLVDDTDLQFSVVAGGHYMVEITLAASGNDINGDYKFAFGVSSGTMTGDGHCLLSSTTNIAAIALITATAASTTTSNNIGMRSDIDAIISVSINFGFYASSNATFSYKFANAGASAGRISRTWKGSILKYKRLD